MELDSDEPTAAAVAGDNPPQPRSTGGHRGHNSQNTASSTGHLSPGAVAVITERLALEPELPLPSSLYQHSAARPTGALASPPHHAVLQYLQRLLAKDPAAFLERWAAAVLHAGRPCKPGGCMQARQRASGRQPSE